MKKLLITVAVVGLGLGLPLVSQAADPRQEMEQFQAYFKKKFPDVPFDNFKLGIYALNKQMYQQYEAINEFPPYEIGLSEGKKLWETPFKNGKTYASCFKNGGKDIAQHYPYWDERTHEIRTAEMDINACRVRNGEPAYTNLNTGPMAEVTAYFKYLSKGQRVSLDIRPQGAKDAYEAGKRYYWARRGQLNFSCNICHVENAGKLLGGVQVLSAGLGHGVGWPAYRADWGQLATLHHRYATCNKQVRAVPLKPQSVQYRDLEFYEMYNDTGLPLDAPSQRN